jgi:5'-methylthioinosine phosphorylase
VDRTRARGRTISLIGGTGLARGLERLLDGATPHHDVEVRFGDRGGKVLFYLEGYCQGLRLILLPRHGPAQEIPDRSPAALIHELGHEAHVWLLHELGVEAVYAFSAVGSLDRDVPLASERAFVVPDAYSRGLGATVHSFGSVALNVHPSMREPFAPALRQRAVQAIEATGCTALPRGLYIFDGPDAFETEAEVRALSRLYAGEPNRLVGMTAGPELILCRQMGLPYALICSNANYAQGLVHDEAVTHQLVLRVMQAAFEPLLAIAAEIVRAEAREAERGAGAGAPAARL